MNTPEFKKSALAITVAIASGMTSATSQAQMLEEVVVTATKRAVGMQDVPIALSVVDGNKMLEQGWMDLEDVTTFLPNVQVTEAFATDALYIRGIGSGTNFGFEQSVGTFIDGVYFGRGQASRTTFMDVERVEVLKGSQSTLFGKNTIAGALNITTMRPSDEFEASLEATYEDEFEAWRTTGIVSGPLTDNFGARLVLQAQGAEGYVENTFTDKQGVQQDNLMGRLVLDWQVTDYLSASLKIESGESDSEGVHEVVRIASDQAIGIWGSADPNIRSVIGRDYKRSMDNFAGRPEFRDSEWDIVTLNAEWDIGEYTLQSITGWVDFGYEYNRDVDASPVQGVNQNRMEAHEQFTQEFILRSPPSDSFEFLAGFFYQDEDLTNNVSSDLSAKNLFDAGAALPPVLGIPDGALDISHIRRFSQEAETWSVFFEGTFHFNDAMRLIAGVRYSEDEKEFVKRADFRGFLSPVSAPEPENLGQLIFAYDNFLRFAGMHVFEDGRATLFRGAPTNTVTPETTAVDTQRDEDHVTGDVTFQWDATDYIMVYAKYSTGYKAGGFDENNPLGNTDAAQYEDETSEGFELGAKMDLLDGRGRLNVALFMTEFDDVQVSTFDGVAAQVVGNAASTSADGIEIDGSFAATDELTLYGSVAYLDSVYDDFKNAACNWPQTEAWVDAGGAAGECVQDVSGQPTPYAPEYSAMLGATYTMPISDGLELTLGTDIAYSDSYFTLNDYDPASEQESFTQVNARIALGDIGGRWHLALLGKNLTDEVTMARSGDIPLAGLGFGNSYVDAINPPRSFQLQAKYNF